MRYPVGMSLALLLVASTLFASDVPAVSDQESIVAQLERTQNMFLESIEGLTEEQWNYKPAPDRWSVAECAEHITASEPFIRAMIAEAMKKELTPEMAAEARKDEMLLTALVDRTKKFKAPEPLIPTNRFGSPAAAVDAFKKERAETIALAKSGVDLRKHGDKHFLGGALDAYGWFLFTSGHSERHTLQIQEVKADAGFPKTAAPAE